MTFSVSSGAQHAQDDVELRPAGLRAAGVVEVDVLLEHAGADERVDLVVGVWSSVETRA